MTFAASSGSTPARESETNIALRLTGSAEKKPAALSEYRCENTAMAAAQQAMGQMTCEAYTASST